MDYYIQQNIGNCKYVLSFHNGLSKHSDGSPFYGVRIFNNKKDLAKAIKNLKNLNYNERQGK